MTKLEWLGSAAPATKVTVPVRFRLPTWALIVCAPATVLVSVVEAWPVASVATVAAPKIPVPDSLKVTGAAEMAWFSASRTLTVTVAALVPSAAGVVGLMVNVE
jgi:hypothetical protein